MADSPKSVENKTTDAQTEPSQRSYDDTPLDYNDFTSEELKHLLEKLGESYERIYSDSYSRMQDLKSQRRWNDQAKA